MISSIPPIVPESFDVIKNQIIQTIQRRPSTIEDLMIACEIEYLTLDTVLNVLKDKKLIECIHQDRGKFYKISQ